MRSQPPSRVATGTADLALTKEQLEGKYRRLAAGVIGEGQSNEIIAMVNELEGVDDLRDLTKLHAPSGGWVVTPCGDQKRRRRKCERRRQEFGGIEPGRDDRRVDAGRHPRLDTRPTQ